MEKIGVINNALSALPRVGVRQEKVVYYESSERVELGVQGIDAENLRLTAASAQWVNLQEDTGGQATQRKELLPRLVRAIPHGLSREECITTLNREWSHVPLAVLRVLAEVYGVTTVIANNEDDLLTAGVFPPVNLETYYGAELVQKAVQLREKLETTDRELGKTQDAHWKKYGTIENEARSAGLRFRDLRMLTSADLSGDLGHLVWIEGNRSSLTPKEREKFREIAVSFNPGIENFFGSSLLDRAASNFSAKVNSSILQGFGRYLILPDYAYRAQGGKRVSYRGWELYAVREFKKCFGMWDPVNKVIVLSASIPTPKELSERKSTEFASIRQKYPHLFDEPDVISMTHVALHEVVHAYECAVEKFDPDYYSEFSAIRLESGQRALDEGWLTFTNSGKNDREFSADEGALYLAGGEKRTNLEQRDIQWAMTLERFFRRAEIILEKNASKS